MIKKTILISSILVAPFILSTTNLHAEEVSEVKKELDTNKYTYFKDVSSDSVNSQSIYTLYRMGIINGYGNSYFGSNENLSRQHFVLIMHRLLSDKAEVIRPAIVFNDIKKSHPYYKEITWAYEVGLIDGYKDKNGLLKFGANDYITKAQLSKILVKAFDFKSEEKEEFIDLKNNHWSYEYVNNLYQKDIIHLEDDESFKPNKFVKRDELARFLMRSILVEDKFNIETNFIREVEEKDISIPTPIKEPVVKEPIIEEPVIEKNKTINIEDIVDIETAQKFYSGYDFKWVADVEEKTLHLYGINDNNEVIAQFIKGEGKELYDIKIGDLREDVIEKHKENKTAALIYGDSFYMTSNDEGVDQQVLTLVIKSQVIKVFFDIHNEGKVSAIFVAPYDSYRSKSFHKEQSVELRDSYEDLMHLLINQSRKEFNLPELTNKNAEYGSLSRNYSQYMIDNDYFDHVSPDGTSTLSSRFSTYNISNLYYMGENIAFGQETVLHAHEAFMNSKGHRDVLLHEIFTNVITGTAFDNNNSPYYTVNFYSLR